MTDNKAKLVKILSIVSAGIMLLALLVFFCCVILQKPLVRLFMKGIENVSVFLFPFDAFCSLAGGVLLSIALIFVAGNKKIGVWADVLVLALSAVVKPVAVYLISLLQNLFVTRTVLAMGSQAIAYNSSLNTAVSAFTSFASLGAVILYVVCGMSIILKLSAKQKEKACVPENFV